jgi:hypothetical protein
VDELTAGLMARNGGCFVLAVTIGGGYQLALGSRVRPIDDQVGGQTGSWIATLGGWNLNADPIRSDPMYLRSTPSRK